MGLMAKPQVITFPFALLLLDYWPLYRLASPEDAKAEERNARVPGRSFGSLVWEKVPWFAMSAVSAVVTMKTQAQAAWAGIPLWVRLGNSSIAYAKYLAKTFWPLSLAPVYPYPQRSISVTAIVLCTATIVALSILAAIFYRRRPYFVGWFWFLGTAVPMIGVVQVGVQSMADRYAYIPLLGIFVVVCWGAADLKRSWRVPIYAGVGITAIVLFGLAVSLHRQVGFWSDNLTLWNHTLEVTGPNYTAEDNVASELLVEGREQEALPHLMRASMLRPDDPAVTLNIANYQRLHGHYEAALDGFAKVQQLTTFPSFLLAARLDSGYAHFALKQYDNAKRDFEAALVTQPGNAEAYGSLGLLAQKKGEMASATQNFERSVTLDPSPVGYLLLAQALEIQGETDAAQAARSRAARSSRDLDRDIATMRQLLAE
jgi:tetratricopeptide (TPR) repeat protein